jgi:hypothetical protein
MKTRFILLAALLTTCGAASAVTQEQVQQSASNIARMHGEVAAGRSKSADPRPDMAVLSEAIRENRLSPQGIAAMHFYRAQGAMLSNHLRRTAGQGVDPTMASGAMSDLDRVIAFGRDIPEMYVSLANAYYYAGNVARLDLNDMNRAMGYWSRCSGMGHAGCQFVVARAYVTGSGGMQPDLKRAVDEHIKIFNTGTKYTCAGTYSALEIGRIAHFGGVRTAEGDEFEWLRRSYELQNRLGAGLKNDHICELARTESIEYLMRLGRGEARTDLLQKAMQHAETSEQKVVAAYLLGQAGEDAFQRAVAATTDKDRACDMHFTAMWNAELKRNAPVAAEHRKHMRAMGPDHCQMELALAQLKFR